MASTDLHEDESYLEAVPRPDIDVTPSFYVLNDSEIRIGRNPSRCHIVVREVNTKGGSIISGEHAVIRRDGNHYVVIDQDSTNGTYVNGKRVLREPYPLTEARMVIGLGSRLKEKAVLRFVDPHKTFQHIEPWLTYDPGQQRFFLLGHAVHVTKDQHRVLFHMYDHLGDVCTREQIATILWGPEFDANQYRDVDQFINKLRDRLSDALSDSKAGTQRDVRQQIRKGIIVTRRHLGYELKDIPAMASHKVMEGSSDIS